MNNNIPQQISQMAQTIFESKNPTPLRVLFLWYSTYPPVSHVDQFVDVVVDLIDQNIPQNILETKSIHIDVIQATPLHGFVSSIIITRLQDGPSIWDAGIFAPGLNLSPLTRPSEVYYQNIPPPEETTEDNEEDIKQTILIFRIMKLVPPERQNDLLMLLLEIKRDMEMLSLDDFVEKWQIQEDE